MERIKLIYISGMGRSGSTLLDMLLATSGKVFGLGEIQRLSKEDLTDGICGCGKTFHSCPLWKQFKESGKNIEIINRVNFMDYMGIILYLCNPFKSKLHFGKKSDDDRLFNWIRPRLKSQGYEFLSDQSKDVGRLIELNQNPNVDLYNIFIIRDGRAVANSFRAKSQGPGKNTFVSLLKWILMNSLLRAYIRKSGVRTLYVSYRSLCQNTEEEFKRIQDFIGITIPDDFADKIRTMKEYHTIGGNRVRRRENRESFAGITYDEKWKHSLNPVLKCLYTVIVWPFNRWWNV